MGKFCGHQEDLSVSSSGRYMWIQFHSDSSVSDSGFTATYSAVDVIPPYECSMDNGVQRVDNGLVRSYYGLPLVQILNTHTEEVSDLFNWRTI